MSKKILSTYFLLFCLVLGANATAQEAEAVAVAETGGTALAVVKVASESDVSNLQGPVDVVYSVCSMIASGRRGYAASQFMPDDGVWNGYNKEELIAAENVIYALKNNNLKEAVIQSQYISDSVVTPENVDSILVKLENLTPEQHEYIKKVTSEKLAAYDQLCQEASTSRMVRMEELSENSVVCLMKKTKNQEEISFVVVLHKEEDGQWKIPYMGRD